MSIKVKLLKLDPSLPTPAYAYPGDAGCDLYLGEDIELNPGERKLAPTGICIAIPDDYAGFIQPRSGLAIHLGLGIINTPGLIDSQYRGEIKIPLINLDRNKKIVLKKGEKIAQLVIQRVEKIEFELVKSLDTTKRNDGGFGSSGR